MKGNNTTINILWIEDNPLISTASPNGESELPEILLKEGFGKFFNLKILQHPEEIKEYLYLCNLIFDKKGPSELGKCEGVIPEIVPFDYMLANNFSGKNPKSISYKKQFKAIREKLNPNYIIANIHSDLIKVNELFSENAEEYTKTKFITSINGSDDIDVDAELKKLESDEFGLFGGIAILRFFKNYITCALPATFEKDRIEKLHPTAKYYEWLNKFDLESSLGREARGSKSWEDILKDGVELLKSRIENQLKDGKIMVSYAHLISLTQPELLTNRVFKFESIYGKRDIPLDGLFFYERQIEKRNDRIKQFADTLLSILFYQKNYTLSSDILNNAFRLSDELWNTYTNEAESVVKRLKISELGYLLSLSNDELAKEIGATETEENYFEAMKDEFRKEYEILSTEFGLRKTGNKEFLEYGFDLRSGNFTCIERRWAVLITMLRLYHHFLKYKKSPDEKLSKKPNLVIEPQEDDYYLALFPIATTPIVTRIHKYDGDNFKKALKRQTTLNENTNDGEEGLELDSILNHFQDANDISWSEKNLLTTLMRDEEEFPLFTNVLNMPSWLK